jgi:hypothetical protein
VVAASFVCLLFLGRDVALTLLHWGRRLFDAIAKFVVAKFAQEDTVVTSPGK